MEVIKFYGRFFGNISAAYGVSGYFQSHTKAKYPPGVFALYVQHIHTTHPDTASTPAGLHLCHPMPAYGVCMELLESLSIQSVSRLFSNIIRD
jgi:hypothetical protein